MCTLRIGLVQYQFHHSGCQSISSNPDHSVQIQESIFCHCEAHHEDEPKFEKIDMDKIP